MILTGIILAKLLTVGKPSVKIISSPGSVALFAGYVTEPSLSSLSQEILFSDGITNFISKKISLGDL